MPIIMPTLPLSMSEGLHKNPSFNTVRQKGPAGINAGIALKPFPTWDFQFSLENIQGHEQDKQTAVAQFLGTFMATAGGAGTFLFTDQQDNTVTNAQFGIADGKSISFQLSRNIFGAVDIIQNVVGTPTIRLNGSLSVPASISPSGIVTITEVPDAGVVLTWSGSFRYLCRFSEDTVDAVRTMTINNGIDTWTMSGIKFSSEFQPGIQNFGVIAAPGGN
jgi:hypothetical protein